MLGLNYRFILSGLSLATIIVVVAGLSNAANPSPTASAATAYKTNPFIQCTFGTIAPLLLAGLAALGGRWKARRDR